MELSPPRGEDAWLVPTKQKLSCLLMAGYFMLLLQCTQLASMYTCSSLVPKVVTPGTTDAAPPSDAVVLFDGKSLDQWVATKDKSPAAWVVSDGILTVDKKAGNIETKRSFKNYQLHLEWRIPPGRTAEPDGKRRFIQSKRR